MTTRVFLPAYNQGWFYVKLDHVYPVTIMKTLKITEIFYSLQGEASTVGCPAVFVRLTGCPLRCGYCDTTYAFTGGSVMDMQQIMQQVAQYTPEYVCVTGGEPLAQKSCWNLLRELCDAGYHVSLETSGALSIEAIDTRVQIVMDVKTPGSGEDSKNRLENLVLLRKNDVVKFVLCDQADYDWAKQFLLQHKLTSLCEVFFSPVFQQMDPAGLAQRILGDRLRVRMQLQLHKIIWGDQPGK